MSDITLYHNPRCSKSRQTLALLQDQGIDPDIVLYLETPPSAQDIEGLLAKLGIEAAALVRKGEAAYQEAGLSADSSAADLVAAMAEYPKLIERPVVVRGERAVLGRPPENALELVDG